MDEAERRAILALTLASGLGPTLTQRAIKLLGSPQAVCDATIGGLRAVEGIGKEKAPAIRQALDHAIQSGAVDRELDELQKQGARMLVLGDADYPRLLAHIIDPPYVLFVRGTLLESDTLALAIVGSRRCSHYGREQADRFAALGAQAGLTIVSGGAYGIDAAAHRAALRVQGRTIAVLGSGLSRPYPEDHVELFEQIVAGGQGAVMSELPMTAPPMAENFPSRNRIISGLSLGVLVVEAALRSGALITARLAAEEHHREVMALPGRVDNLGSAGCHKIIREGWATLVTQPAEVLDALGETGSLLKAGLTQAENQAKQADSQPGLFDMNLTPSQQKIVAALGEPLPLDRLAAITGLAVGPLQADLTMLEIRGLLRRSGGMIERRGGR